MPIRVQNDLPVKEILEKENIFVMDENRAVHQDIRPIKIGLLNLMPLKEDTELQLLRSLSNTPLQVDIVFLAVKNHVSKNTSANHLNRFYENFENVKDQKFDGFIITGAPVEQMPFEEVDYWEELVEGKKDQQRAGKRFFCVQSGCCCGDEKGEPGDCQSADRCNIRWVWKRFWHTAFAGD